MNNNDNLYNAKKAKDDEFYTQRADVEELLEYLEPFKDKRILCPCDSERSFFYIVLKENGFNVKRSSDDFRLDAGLLPYGGKAIDKDLWDWADIIVTNPPFSIATQFVEQCLRTNKKFILLLSGLTFIIRPEFNKDYFLLHGVRQSHRQFIRPDGSLKGISFCEYFQNLIGRPVTKGYNPPIYGEKYKMDIVDTPHGQYRCYKGGGLPSPLTTKGKILAPISCLYRLDEEDYKLVGVERRVYLNGKQTFFRLILESVRTSEN